MKRDYQKENKTMSKKMIECFDYYVKINPEINNRTPSEKRYYFIINLVLNFFNIETDHGANKLGDY